MKDGIIKNTGNSRAIRATLPATYEEFVQKCAEGTLLADVLFNADGWQTQPTFLNKANLLSDETAALYGIGPGTAVTVDLSTASVGDTVTLVRNGQFVEFLIGAENYESELNGEGYKLLVEKNPINNLGAWNTTDINEYANSTIDVTLNTSYINGFPQAIKEEILDTTFYSIQGNKVSTVNQLKRKVFLPSIREFGLDDRNAGEGSPIQSLSSISFPSSDYVTTRSPNYPTTRDVYCIGSYAGSSGTKPAAARTICTPCFCLPSDFNHTWYIDNGVVSDDPVDPVPDDIFNILAGGAKIEFGSYVGTGKYGIQNPNVLTFSFQPKFLTVSSSTFSPGRHRAIFPYGGFGLGCIQSSDGDDSLLIFGMNTTWSGKSISWGNTADTIHQLNRVSTTYNYVAIG